MSTDQHKTKQELIDELNHLRGRIAELESAGNVDDSSRGEPMPGALRWCNALEQITDDALGVLDVKYVYKHVNTAYERFWGRPKEELIGRSVPELFGEAMFSSQMKARLDRCLAGEVARYSDWFESPSLGRRYMDVVYHPLRDPEGQVIGLVNLARDMTNQALAEEELKQQKNQLQHIGEMAQVGGWELDARTMELTWTEQTFAIHELPVGQAPDVQTGIAFYHPEHQPKITAVVRAALEQAQPYDVQLRLITAKGRHLWTRSIGLPVIQDGEVVKLTGAFQDITEHKQAEIALQQAKEHLEQAIRSANVGLWDWDLTTDNIHFSAEWARQIGCTEEDIGDTLEEWTSRVHPDDKGKPLADLEAMLHTPGKGYEGVFRFRHKNGQYRWILSQATAHRDKTGKPVRIIGSHIDITRQKQLEQERLRLEAIAACSPDFVGISDLDGHALYLNPAGRRLVGLTADSDIANIRITDFLWPEDRASGKECIAELLEKGRFSCEIRFQHFTDDRLIEMHVEAFRVDDPVTGQPLFIGTVSRDVTERNRLTAHLKESERKFRSMVEFAPLGVAIADAKGVLKECNQALTDILGYSKRELIGQCFASFTHPDDAARQWTLIEQLLTNRIRSYSLEKRYIRKDNTLCWVNITSTLFPNQEDGEGLGLTFIEDITERMQAQRRLEKSQFILREAEKLAGVGAWEWDIAAERFLVSENWCLIHGTDNPTPRMQELLPIAHPEDRAAIEQAWAKVLEEGRDYVIEHRIVRQDTGEVRYISAKGQPRLDASGQVARMYGAALDVTEQKRNEDALRQAKEQAEAASQAKSMFLANMSHELRTPLNGVLGMLHILEEAALEPALAEAVGIAISSSRTLLTVIKDILDFSKIEAGKLRLAREAFDLPDLLQSVPAAFAHQAQSKGLALHTDIAPDLPAWVVGDVARLRQVLFNLLGNAIKFTERGEVRLSTRALSPTEQTTDQTQMRLEFTVTDTGIGIPADRLADIFESFSQVEDASTRRFQGTGLGLAIVKRLVDLMGGQVSITSTLGQGTVARFDVAVGTATEPAQASQPAQRPPSTGQAPTRVLQILVVDDEATNVKVLSMMLTKLGHQIEAAANGLQALDKLRRQPFDLVFMDAAMPEMGGIETTQKIRENQHGDLNPSVRIVALTANAMRGDREKYLDAGMDDYLSKPIDAKALRAVLETAMAQGGLPAPPRCETGGHQPGDLPVVAMDE
ncbi:Autoinducer 2 sensor kinase/phosphatase LuxQ [Thiorhodovibrio winogradskyi]|uniref:histidine kinase n=1 Tax=Thiorhodovibrio winogradskyi TaxID=77007 RepID=A0ABZ0SEC9_9GAMM|nr:PAS domain S-box protein [Thiorhodovibrio winogradskyi]